MKSKNIIADLHFIKPDNSIQPEVIYTGGENPQIYNEAYQFMPASIIDARALSNNSFSIHKHGFELTTFTPQHTDFDNTETTSDLYYKEVAQLIKEKTAANHVYVFDHTVRKAIPGSTRRPAYHIHNDYTHESGLRVAEESIGSDTFAAMAGKRMIQINVWKSLNGTVKRSPLALCDASSVEYADLVKTQIIFKSLDSLGSDSLNPDSLDTDSLDTDSLNPDSLEPDKYGEIFALRQNPKQRWMYFPEITTNEALLIKGYDTDFSGVARFTPHTAFEYPNQDESAEPRHSIEARAFAFFD